MYYIIYINFCLHFLVVLISNICPFIIEPFMPHILGIFLFINETQQHHKMHVVTEYFVDQEKYFYFISLHMTTSISLGLIITAAAGSLLIGYIIHACGLFRIVRWENVYREIDSRNCDNNNKNIVLISQIFSIINKNTTKQFIIIL